MPRALFAIVIGLVSAVLFISVATACMSVPDGWYIEANGGVAHLVNKTYVGTTNHADIGGNGNIGYKFLPYVAAEIGYSLYPNYSMYASSGMKAATDKHNAYDVALKGIWPFSTSGVEVFAKLGADRIASFTYIHNLIAANQLGIVNSSKSQLGVYLGIGVQYYFIPQLAAVMQWQRATGDAITGTEDLYSLGLSFIFQ